MNTAHKCSDHPESTFGKRIECSVCKRLLRWADDHSTHAGQSSPKPATQSLNSTTYSPTLLSHPSLYLSRKLDYFTTPAPSPSFPGYKSTSTNPPTIHPVYPPVIHLSSTPYFLLTPLTFAWFERALLSKCDRTNPPLTHSEAQEILNVWGGVILPWAQAYFPNSEVSHARSLGGAVPPIPTLPQFDWESTVSPHAIPVHLAMKATEHKPEPVSVVNSQPLKHVHKPATKPTHKPTAKPPAKTTTNLSTSPLFT